MAVLDDVDADATAHALGLPAETRAAIPWDAAKRVLAHAVWQWFDAHRNDRIVKVGVKIWFLPIRATLKVKDLELPITLIFGGRPW